MLHLRIDRAKPRVRVVGLHEGTRPVIDGLARKTEQLRATCSGARIDVVVFVEGVIERRTEIGDFLKVIQ